MKCCCKCHDNQRPEEERNIYYFTYDMVSGRVSQGVFRMPYKLDMEAITYSETSQIITGRSLESHHDAKTKVIDFVSEKASQWITIREFLKACSS
jgi:hypothetical protein